MYGVELYKDGAAPKIILTGERIQWTGGESSEAESLATILELMGIPRSAMILESKSLTTYENAVFTKQILLVTSAAHMPRLLGIFSKQGIKAIPAPADFMISDRNLIENCFSVESRILSFIRNAQSLDYTTQALKKYIGTLIYRLKGWLSEKLRL
ncbi:MAG TPA: YdcF family protein [Coleofasciculaceae cyanobacterium]